MSSSRIFLIILLGTFSSFLTSLLAAAVESSVGRFTLYQAIFMGVGIIVGVILAAFMKTRPARDSTKLYKELRQHRRELYRLKKLNEAGLPWTHSDAMAWVDHQLAIKDIKDVLEDRGLDVDHDPIDNALAPRLERRARIIRSVRQSAILSALLTLFITFPIIFSFSLFLSQTAQHGYLRYIATPTPTPTPTGAPAITPTPIQTPEPTKSFTQSPLPPTATLMQPTPTPVPSTATLIQPTPTPAPPTATLMQPTVTPSPTLLIERPTSGRIAYTEYVGVRDPGRYDIYIANVDGSGRYRLVERASEPALSPDGRRLAFFSWTEGGIFVINLDGTGRARVSPDYYDTWPTWSPDQRKIAYTARRGIPRYDIYSTTIGDRRETNIIDGEQPSWGPDGRIVYKGCLVADCGLMIVNPTDKVPVRITMYANDSNPIWSHVTNQIVFASDRAGNWDIWTVNPDGTGLRQLTTSPQSDVTPTWSADGQWIFFRSDRDGEWAIWAMRPDGSNQVKLFPSRVSGELRLERLSAGR